MRNRVARSPNPDLLDFTKGQNLKILMVLYLPADRALGGARIQVELAEALRHKGHEVEFLTGSDVFPVAPRNKLEALVRSFSRSSRHELRRQAGAYDVIDGLEGSVTVSKVDLRFEGVLVARSQGLRDAYARWRREAATHRPELRGRLLSRGLRGARRRYELWEGRASRRYADGFFVPNSAERHELVAQLGPSRVCELPFGLTDPHRLALAAAGSQRRSSGEPCVAFIGTWDVRKGKHDFGRIIRSVRAAEPGASFKFLGTRAGREEVIADLCLEAPGPIEVIPEFDPERLPELMATATVGVFPSYAEGFGFAVLEQLAAGLPVVAYDIPGPHDILSALDARLLVEPGNTELMSARIVAASRGEIVSSQACIARAAQFRWDDIADKTVEAYEAWAQST